MESPLRGDGTDKPALGLRMLGPLSICRDGERLTLPASRKVRALIAYLALAPLPVPRHRLCDLLWDVPNDPRAELRWCLSKIRSLLDEAKAQRVYCRDDAVELKLTDCFVDAIEINRACKAGIEGLPDDRLRAVYGLFAGEFLEGLEIARCPTFDAWLTGQRRWFRRCQTDVLEQLVERTAGDERLGYLDRWRELAPFDRRVHETILIALAGAGRIREAEEHLATTGRLFEAEGLDCTPIRVAWREMRTGEAGKARVIGPDPALRSATVDACAIEIADRLPASQTALTPRRASLAVMPFDDLSVMTGARGGLADGLAHDVITRLAKLRSMFVIAQGTVFALHDRCICPPEAGRMLNVDYVVGGLVRAEGRRLSVHVELAETKTARIIWAEVFNEEAEDAFLVLEEIGNRIVASIDSEIESTECKRAVLRPPNSLDAWEAHHRGLWHMYRFSEPDNRLARHFFETAIRADPTFSRAYAGLSFTHFQTAFQGWAGREPEVERAYETAGQALMVDDRDPAAHWAMGRALWLRGRVDESLVELEEAVALSPNFAQGHYTLAFVRAQSGDPQAAILSSDHSRHLSPFDPLLFGMLGARAIALVRLGRFREAAEWAVKAAARPNAHPHIRAIAALSLSLAELPLEARAHVQAIHRTLPHYGLGDFLLAFRFDRPGEALFREGAKRIDMA